MVSDIPCNSYMQKRTIGALLISEKNRFLNKKRRDGDNRYLIKGLIQSVALTIINIYVSSNIPSKHIKQKKKKMVQLKGLDNSTKMVGYFNIQLSIIIEQPDRR